MDNIRFYKRDGESVEIKYEEDLLEHILKLIHEYQYDYVNAPDTLYCSPTGYAKLQAYAITNNRCTYISVLGLKPSIVPKLNREFDVYNSKSEDYIHMI